MSKVAPVSLWLLFLFIVLEGPLRFLFLQIGVPSLIYFKDVILVGFFCYAFWQSVTTTRIDRTFGLMLVLLGYGTAVGLINGLSLWQVLFGAKILLVFLVGYVAVLNHEIDSAFFVRLFRWLVPMALLGLGLDLFFELPWKGVTYESFGATVETSRDLRSIGLPRLAGFGRAAYETAAILFSLSALYLGSRVGNSKIGRTQLGRYDLLLLVFAFAGIVLTTSKTAILAFLALLIFFVVVRTHHRYQRWVKVFSGISLKAILCLLFVYGAVPPAISLLAPRIITEQLRSDNPIFTLLGSSYLARMQETWPKAAELLTTPWLWLTGRGAGGIGTAQIYFEPGRYSPADNLYVYLVTIFGAVILGGMVIYLLYRILMSRADEPANIYLYMLAISLFGFGATINVVESASLSLTAGFMLAIWYRETQALSNRPVRMSGAQ